MADRMDRINELMRREISSVIQREFEWQNVLVTVTGVEVTRDLKEGKVFVGVLGGAAQPVIDKLKKNHGLIQSKVAERVVLKNTPVLDFRGDHSAERGVDIVNLLDEVAELPQASPEEEE